MRERLGCHTFKWYLDTVHPEQYIPELDPMESGMVAGPSKKLCLDSMGRKYGPIGLYGCHGWGNQRWNLGKAGLLYTVGEMICLRSSKSSAGGGNGNGDGSGTIQAIQTTKCPKQGATNIAEFQWEYVSGTIRPIGFPGHCLDQTGLKGGGEPTCKPCIQNGGGTEAALGQQWVFAVRKDNGRG